MADDFFPDFGGYLGDFTGTGGWSYSGLSDVLRGAGDSSPFSGLTVDPGSGMDWSGLAGQLFGGLKDYGLPALKAGTGLMGLASGIRGGIQTGQMTALEQQAIKRQADLAKLAQQEAKPMADFSQAELGMAQQGKIPPAVQAQIDQWAQAAKQRVMQMAAQSGQGESSQLQAWLSWIDQQAQAMGAQALQDEIRSGIAAGGTAGSIIGAGAGAAGGAGYGAAGQQSGMEQIIAAANAAIARLG